MYPNLKLQLWRSGIRQCRLAQLVGIHETALSKIVNGFRAPDSETRKLIAEILQTDEGWLFEQDIPQAPKREEQPGPSSTTSQ